MSDSTGLSRHERLVESFVPVPLRLAASGSTESGATPMALLWIDIAQSTRLTVRLAARGPSGIEELAALLGRHFDALLKLIVAHGGEPLMFAGDGLIAGWRRAAAATALTQAAACGLAILNRPAPPSGETLRLHAALAFGAVDTLEIASDTMRVCVTAGAGLVDLQSAADLRVVGRLLVSKRARALLADAAFTPVGFGTVALAALRGVPAPVPLEIAPLPEAAREALSVLVPLPVMSRLDHQDLSWAAELRRVTVIFAKLPDLDQAAPDIAKGLATALGAISPVIALHDGVLRQFWGDETGTNLLVLFGIPPIAHRDDAARGIRCALDMQEALRRAGQPSHIGIATGNVFIGVVGNDTLRSWVTLGEPLNLAARLKSLGQAPIQCDETTMRGAGQGFAFTKLPPSQIRGLAAAVPSWSPSLLRQPPLVQPLFGRAEPLAQLRAALAAESGALVLIEAEAGLGKSHLLASFRQQAAAGGALVLTGEASRIEAIVPYRGWRGVVSGLLELDQDAPPAARREAALAALGPELAPQAALLNAILPLDLPESEETMRLLPAQRAALRLSLVAGLLRRAARRRKLLVTIDDAHWLDEESWGLAEAAGGIAGLCLALALQPLNDERWPAALAAKGARRLRLAELPPEDEIALALSRLGAERLSPALAGFLRERANGHPFIGLELIEMLRESELVEVTDGICRLVRPQEIAALKLPYTVQGLITRRLDQLDPDSQMTLKVASAAGLKFPAMLVRDVHPTARGAPERVAAHLAAHHRSGLLIQDAAGEPDGYEFRHGIIRDVTYGLMLVGQRRQLHREILKWYESRSELSGIYTLLAYHAEAAGDAARAAELLTLEARRVFGLGLARQSAEIGLRAARLLGAEIPGEADALREAIGTELGSIATLMANRQPQDLAGLPRLEDAKAKQLIRLLLTLAPFAYQSHQVELFALLGCICLRLTLEHGNGDLAPDVYCMYSVVYGALTDDRDAGFAWSRLGLDLQHGARGASYARCAFMHAWFNHHWLAPLAEAIALSAAAAEAGFSDDEMLYGCFNLSAAAVLSAAAGEPLGAVMEMCRAHSLRNGKRVLNADYHLVFELQYAKALAGLTAGPLELGDAEYDAARDIDSVLNTDLSNQIGYYMVMQLKLHVMAGAWAAALDWAIRADTMLPFFAGQSAEFELAQYRGLAAYAAALLTPAPDRAALLELGATCSAQLRRWAARNPDAFGHKSAMLDALAQAAEGDHDAAGAGLAQAAAAARSGGCLHDAGLAHEMAARLLAQRGERDAAAQVGKACAVFRAWGAAGKAARLAAEFGLLPAREGQGALPLGTPPKAEPLESVSWGLVKGSKGSALSGGPGGKAP